MYPVVATSHALKYDWLVGWFQMRSEALSSSQAGGVLLTQTEAKIIFGALMPIARTHHAILKDLRFIHNNWTETANIGEVFQRYVSLRVSCVSVSIVSCLTECVCSRARTCSGSTLRSCRRSRTPRRCSSRSVRGTPASTLSSRSAAGSQSVGGRSCTSS